MKADGAFLIVVRFALQVLAIGILTVLVNDTQTLPIEPIIIAGTTALGRPYRNHERRLTQCRPMQSSHSHWSGCQFCSSDPAACAPTIEPETYRRHSESTVPVAR